MNCGIIAVFMSIILSIMGYFFEHCSNKASRTTQADQAFAWTLFCESSFTGIASSLSHKLAKTMNGV